MKIERIIILFALISFASGCKHELFYPEITPVVPVDTSGSNPNPEDTMICFETQILPLFQSNCAMSGCHDAITHEEGFRLYDYAHIIQDIVPNQPTQGDLMDVILETDPDKVMPPPPSSPLSSAQIALIQQWINQGAMNTTNCASSCDTTAFAYTANIAPIMSSYCNGCHSGTFPSAGINTTSHAGLQSIVSNGSLLGSVQHTSGFVAMPQNAAKLSTCNITKIRKWILAGAPNN